MALISVIVPVYKVEPYLSRCIDSILAQTFTDFELILIDDGSPDRCGEICEGYATKDHRIHVIHRKNGGLSAARNTGIEWVFANSESQWLNFIDSDDWVHPDYLSLLYQAVLEYQTNISQCMFYETDGKGALPEAGCQTIAASPNEQYLNYYNPHAWGKLYRKECFSIMRYPEGKLYEDVAIWYKLLFSERKIAIVNEPLYYYFYREDSIMNSQWKPNQLDQIYAWEEQLEFLKTYDNQKVFQEGVKRSLWVLSNQLRAAGTSKAVTESERKKYSSLLRNKMCILLKEYKAFLKNTDGYHWYWEQAHPRASWCYWTLKGMAGKLRGKRK